MYLDSSPLVYISEAWLFHHLIQNQEKLATHCTSFCREFEYLNLYKKLKRATELVIIRVGCVCKWAYYLHNSLQALSALNLGNRTTGSESEMLFRNHQGVSQNLRHLWNCGLRRPSESDDELCATYMARPPFCRSEYDCYRCAATTAAALRIIIERARSRRRLQRPTWCKACRPGPVGKRQLWRISELSALMIYIAGFEAGKKRGERLA